MKNSLYRFFSKDEYADAFLNGHIFMNSLSYFRGIEDDFVRGDELEGVMQHTPSEGLEINNLTTGTRHLLPGWSFRSKVPADEAFVLCMSRSKTERHWKDFSAVVCAEITDKRRFLSALQQNATERGLSSKARAVAYTSFEQPPLHNWALPEEVCFRKSKNHYLWQDEYRFVAASSIFFSAERVQLELSADPIKHEKSAYRSLTIDVGPISDFCRLDRKP